jgi:hypothetical protein
MRARNPLRRKLVPILDRLESRELLSVASSPFHPMPHRHLVHAAQAGPSVRATNAPPATASVSGLNKLTSLTSNGLLYATAAVASNDVWAVGTVGVGASISTIESSEPLIEHFNGTSWTLVKSPLPRLGGVLNGVAALASNNVWVVGQMNATSTGGGFPISVPLIEHWNGTNWSIVAAPNPSPVLGAQLLAVSAISANNIFAVGTSGLVEHWNGLKWNIVTSPEFPPGASLNAISADSATDIWVVGANSMNSDATPVALHFDGHAWSSLTVPAPPTAKPSYPIALHGVTAISPTDVWAVGTAHSDMYPFPTIGFIEHFDGTSWKIVPSPNPEGGLPFAGSFGLMGIAASSATDIWAVGTYSDPKTGFDLPLTEHWDGTSWTMITSAHVPGVMNVLRGVSALADGTVVAAGFTTMNGGVDPFNPQFFLGFDQPLILQN